MEGTTRKGAFEGTRPAILGALVVGAILGSGPAAAQEPGCCPEDPCCDVVAPAGTQDTLGLAEVVRLAMDRNREIAAARHGLEEAENRVSEAWGNVYPSLDLSTSYTRNLSPAVNFIPARFLNPDAPADELIALQFGADNQWNGTLSVEQPVFNGAAFLGVGAAGRYEALQEEVVRGEVQRVVTSVRGAYHDLLLAQEQVRLTENSVRRVRETLEETRALNRAGLASDYEVLRLEVELANLEPNLLRAVNAVRQARRELGVTLSLDDPDGVAVRGSLATMDIASPMENDPANREILAFSGVDLGDEVSERDAERLVNAAVESRSDVRQLELTESLRETEVSVERMSYLPKVSVFGSYSVNSSQNGDPQFFGYPRAYGRTAGIQVTVPVFQGLQRDARIDQKQAVVRSVRAQASLARDRTRSQVLNLLDQVAEARARARAQALAVEQARRGFDIARAQFREGLSSQLELTDAEVALRQSEFNYAQAVYDFLSARARLDEATGRVPLTDGPR
jgi:outer membrane protein TolC